jgi:hypothetical protein
MKKQKPFFAKFLENQLSRAEQRRTQGGTTTEITTLRHLRTDIEESPAGPVYEELTRPQTDKYPSDSEDH